MPPTLNSTHRQTGRNVTILTIVLGIAGAIAPMVANMDLTSTAGVVAALVAVTPVIFKYLDGSQKYEERLDNAVAVAAPVTPVSNGRPTDEMLAELADVPDPPGDDELEDELAAVTAGDDEPDA